MSKILIIGNVLKDVYLKLDERKNTFEEDEAHVSWLNLGFDGAAHAFFQRTSTYGGAAVSLAVLNRMGLDARILNSRTEYRNGELVWQDDPTDYRYILCHGGEITYFVPSARGATDWKMPDGQPEWILVDRSAVVSPRLVDEIQNFLKLSPATKLAVHAEKYPTPAGRKLAEIAQVVFTEGEPPRPAAEKIVDKIEHPEPHPQTVCYITPRKIILGDAEETYLLSREDMLTHLTAYATIVATVLGVLSAGGSAALAVMWARLNAEQSTLTASLSARKLQELTRKELEKRANLKLIAKSLVAPKMGVLALDDSERTLSERLGKALKLRADAETNRACRAMIVTTPELREYISGVILTPEVARAKVLRNQSYLEYLTNRGIITGIKADAGQAQLNERGETYTLGSDDLPERLRTYYAQGARFAKWHARFVIGQNLPSYVALERNAELAADFAKECQLAGIVPMVESDVQYFGDYRIEECLKATDRALTTMIEKLTKRKVDLAGCLIKTNMVLAGGKAKVLSTPKEVGVATAAILKHSLPEQTAGVLLLSGGQTPKQALENFRAVRHEDLGAWPVTFAFGRAATNPAIKAWQGKAENVKAGQAALKNYLQDLTK